MWDLSSQLGIETAPPAVEALSLNHWTAKEVHLALAFIHPLKFTLSIPTLAILPSSLQTVLSWSTPITIGTVR